MELGPIKHSLNVFGRSKEKPQARSQGLVLFGMRLLEIIRTSTVATTNFSNFPRFLCVQLPNPSLPTQASTDLISIKSSTTTTQFKAGRAQPSFPNHFSSYGIPHKSFFTNSEVGFLHAQAIKSGSTQHLNVCNHLLSLYARCSQLHYARKLFDEMSIRDVRTWTILITGFARMNSSKLALDVFIEMQTGGVCPNHFTFSCVLKCCASIENLEIGKKVHGWMVRNEVRSDVALENSLLHFYVQCGAMGYARTVFDSMREKDTVSWNIMIDGYLQNGDIDTSLELFKRLPWKDTASWNTIVVGLMHNGCDARAMELLEEMGGNGIAFNEFTFSIALYLAASLAILKLGRQIHTKVLKIGVDQDGFIRNSLIDMYCKCGEVDEASAVFNGNPRKSEMLYFGSKQDNCFLWSSIISGHVQNGKTEEALELFRRMVFDGVAVDQFTLTTVVSACADIGIGEQGSQIHALIEKLGHQLDDFLVSTIIDMYGKCGRLDDALLMFYQSSSRNIVVWTSVISVCALHGHGREAIHIFELMLEGGIRPNKISFVGVLSGCSHAGLVEEGWGYFKSMQEDYCIVPELEHFTCMVDLLGRAGYLEDAKDFIVENGVSHQSAVWRAFLSACRVHRNIELGQLASKQLLELEPHSAGSYVMLSNICTTTDRWKEAAETRSLMQKRGVLKHPGQSWIRLKNRVHTFVVGDRSHPQAADIYSFLERLIARLKEVGYSSDTNLAMHDVEEEQKEILLGFHSEKLAVAYGIMCTSQGVPVMVMKNLRICVDCHTAIKCISQVTGREITVRDSRRFHHFKHGYCSCGDYW